jgi:hypothetical protein
VIAYPAMLDVPRELVQYLGRLLAAERPTTGCYAACAGRASAASRSWLDAGGLCVTPPPAHAGSAISSPPHCT